MAQSPRQTRQSPSRHCTVVCSQHFLNDDIYTTESGSRNIRTGAIPSMVQVCMICLDTRSKLYLMSKYKLDEVYQHLVGHPLCDQGNLKQTLCVQCAQRLVNFNKFRDKSLRARSLLLELVEQHELITMQHIKSISRVKHKLKSDIVRTVLGPNQFAVYIAHSDTDIKTMAMEHDKSDSMSVDADQSRHMAVMSAGSDADSCNGSFVYEEEYLSDDSYSSEVKQMSDPPVTTSSLCEMTAETSAAIKQEVTFACTTCLKEFDDENMYIHHTLMHTEDTGNLDDDSVAGCSLSSVAPLPTGLATNQENDVHPTDTNDELHTLVLDNNKKTTVEDFRTPQIPISQRDKSLTKVSNDIKFDTTKNKSLTKVSNDIKFDTTKNKSLTKVSNYIKFDTTMRNELFNIKKIVSENSSEMETKSSPESQQYKYTCDICQAIFNRKGLFFNHVKYQTCVKLLTCKFCKYQCKHNSTLVQHMTTHTGEEPFACKVCNRKFLRAYNLNRHMRTHTGEKPFACKLCYYKCRVKSSLVRHMRSHTGEKPYVCKVCDYKFIENSSLVKHMRTHTGEKPFVCKFCGFKCTQNSNLVQHIRTHTGKKPFACKMCDYNCSVKSSLVEHMRAHPA